MRAGAKVLYKWRLVCCKLSANVLMLTEKSVKSVVYLCDHFNHRAAALVLSILVQLVVFEGLPWNNFGCRTDLVAVLHTNRSQYDTWWPISVVDGNVRQGHCTAMFKAHGFWQLLKSGLSNCLPRSVTTSVGYPIRATHSSKNNLTIDQYHRVKRSTTVRQYRYSREDRSSPMRSKRKS